MEVADIVFSAVFNILSICINIRVINLFLNKKKNPKLLAILAYGLFWLENWLIYYICNNRSIVVISFIIGAVFVVEMAFDGSYGKKFIAIGYSWAHITISEEIIWCILHNRQTSKNIEVLGSILSVLLALVILVFLEKYIQVDKNIVFSKKSYLHLIMLSAGSALIGMIVVEYLSMEHKKSALLVLVILYMINVSAYYLYVQMSLAYYKKLENAVLRERIFMYQNQFEVINQSQESIRLIRHDIKNHMLLLQSYLYDKDYEKALMYIDEIENHMTTSSEYVKTGNKEIDSILNYMLRKADMMGCEIKTLIEVPKTEFMSEFDLNIILSNLLKNALEALEKIEKGKLHIYIKFQKGILYVSIYNTFDGKIEKAGKNLLTTKREKENHGMGFVNINSIVEKYEGSIGIQQEGDLFKVDIMLYLEVV